MTDRQREIPPGHTKPPIVVSKDKTLAAKPKFNFDPRKLPKNAQYVLMISAALAFALMLLDPDPMSGVDLVALISLGAFAEARREEGPIKKPTLGHLYDRALSHALWLAVSMLPFIFLGIGVRRLLGLYTGQVD